MDKKTVSSGSFTTSSIDLKEFLCCTGLGKWTFIKNTRELDIDENFRAICGMDPCNLSLKRMLSIISKCHRQDVIKTIRETYFYGTPLHVEFSFQSFSGGIVKWARIKGKHICDETGKTTRITGMLEDISNEKLKEQYRDDLIFYLNHEFKTPLSLIKLYIQMLKKSIGRNPILKVGIMTKAETQVNYMTQIANDFLCIASVESKKLNISRTEFDLAGLTSQVVSDARQLYRGHRFTLLNGEMAIVTGDKNKLRQVIDNYIANSVKYSLGGTEITVHCKIKNKRVVVSVKDQGVGIQLDDQARIFERYYRVKETSGQGGFGIGLYLVKQTICAHNGEVWVSSEPGHGSVFYFDLPLK